MKELKKTLLQFGEAHPAAEPTDYIKLLYQNEFGCGHLCPDGAKALSLLTEEWENMAPSPAVPLFESIGGGSCRLNLGALQREDLPLAARLFVLSAQTPRGSEASFREKLSLLTETALTGGLPLDGPETAEAVQSYLLKGVRPVRHSEGYRRRYAPHYRVIETPFAVFFPALRAAETLIKAGENPIFAVDGRCGSGKTALGETLQRLFDCNLFHMDDFFLPAELRTPKRLETPGENIHYERFDAQVLTPLLSGKPFCYRPFCCQTGGFGPPLSAAPRPLAVVEGTYSMHPALRSRYGGSAFLTIPPEVQQKRLLAREGKKSLQAFNERWIPLEERYFKAFRVAASCQVAIDTSPLDDCP